MVQNISDIMFTPLQNIDEMTRWDNRPFIGAFQSSRREKSADIKKPIKKKPKRIRTAYTTDQIKTLEIIFSKTKYVSPERRHDISKALNIGDKSVKIWFQNRRMKEKKESSDSSDSSISEISACEMSPPLSLSDIHVGQINDVSKNNLHTPNKGYQYETSNFNVNYSHIEGDYVPDNITTQFYYDNNVYPTQFYPPNDSCYLNNCTGYYQQHQQENETFTYYWNSSHDSNYFCN